MAEEPQSFWKTLPGILTAAGAFIGSIAALITALYSAGMLTVQTPHPSGGRSEGGNVAVNNEVSSSRQIPPSGRESEPPPPETYSTFYGRYSGISTEGLSQSRFEVELERHGNSVVGSYYLGNQRGEIRGNVKGNTLYYDWQLGNLFGKGISTEKAGKIEGSWGYGLSTDNAGTSSVSRVR